MDNPSLAGSWLSFGATWWHLSALVQISLGLILGSVHCLEFARTSLQIIPSFVWTLQKLWVSQVPAVGTQLLVLCFLFLYFSPLSLLRVHFLCTPRKDLRTWRMDTNHQSCYIRICVIVVIIGLCI